MRKTSVITVLWLLSLSAADALRDCWSCGRAGYWQWHLCKWWFLYGTIAFILWKRWPLVYSSWWEYPKERRAPLRYYIFWRHLIMWAAVAVLGTLAWTAAARTIGGQPTWGGLLGIF